MKAYSARPNGIRRLWWSAPIFALLIWANWEPLPLSERYELPPVSFTTFDIGQPISTTDSLQLAQTLPQLVGITSATINRVDGLFSIAYQNPGVLQQVKTIIQGRYIHASVKDFDIGQGPVCSIPQSYIRFPYAIKKLLCFR